MSSRVGDQQLLWIDVQGRERRDLDAVAARSASSPVAGSGWPTRRIEPT